MAGPVVDDILSHIGHGRFQYLVFFTCSSWGIFGSMHLMLAAFLVPQSTDFECNVKDLQETNWTLREIRNFSIPWSRDEGYSKCYRYDMNFSEFNQLNFDEAVKLKAEDFVLVEKKCDDWIYDDHRLKSTVISEWDLVCDRQYLRSLVQSVFMAGVFVAALIGGVLADKYGRIRLITIGLVLYITIGIMSSFSPTFELFLVTRFLVALSGNFVYLTSYVLMIEWCQPKQRSIMGLAFSVPFALGYMTLPFAAYYAQGWRYLMMGISGFTCILIVNIVLMAESPRWLIQKRRLAQTVKVINYARKINGHSPIEAQDLAEYFPLSPSYSTREEDSIPTKDSDLITDWESSDPKPSKNGREKKRRLMLFSPKLSRFVLILTLNWFVCNLVYYGLSLGTGNFGVDPFLYMFLGGLMEIPCYTVVVPFIVKYGRRIPLISFLGVCGISIIASLALPADNTNWALVSINMFAKLNITAAFQLLYLYTSEIFPTNVRTQGVGITSMVGRIGSILSPLITDIVGTFDQRFPPLIFGCCCLLATLMSLFLPETYENQLPDTAEDVERWNQRPKDEPEK